MRNLAIALIYFLCFFPYFLMRWLVTTYGENLSFDNIVFHAFIGINGIEGTDTELLKSFKRKVMHLSFSKAIIIYLIFVSAYYIRNPKKFLELSSRIKALILRITDILQNKILIFLIFISTLLLVMNNLKFYDFFKARFGEDIFVTHYKKPIIETNNKETKNLILIYLESVEHSFRNKDIFGKNLLRPIDELPGHRIDNYVNAPGATWTMAGMVASQCSIPLKQVMMNQIGKNNFLPGALCIGNALNSNQYIQYYLVGPDLNFGGMKSFYNDHKYDYSLGKNEFYNLGMDYKLFTGWGGGPSDDIIYDEATKLIKKLDSEGKRYNITITTTDNHAPEGCPSPRCTDEERHTGIRGVVQCTSKQTASFIENLMEEGLLKNTVIVMTGDHLFMDTKHQNHLFPEPRYVYFKYISPDENMIPTRNKMNHFDIAPTILHLLGVNSKDNDRFGLGISLFSDISEDEYNKHFDEVVSKKILNHSDLYNSFYKSK